MTIKEKLYRKFAEHRFEKRYKRITKDVKRFNGFISNSKEYLILMPFDNEAFREAYSVALYLQLHKKNVSLIIFREFTNVFAEKKNYRFFVLKTRAFEEDLTLQEKLIAYLSDLDFDVFIDLMPNETFFTKLLAMNTKAKYKIAVFERESEKLYDILLNEKPSNNLEKSFGNLLNSLQMF